MKLYSYWRSTTSYRTRIALHLKGLTFETVPVSLLEGEQREDSYVDINPSKGVPTLELADGTLISQSMAIISFLETLEPLPALVPPDPLRAAKVNAAAYIIASDIHPINNLRVSRYLKTLGISDGQTKEWLQHWMREGLLAYQSTIDADSEFSFGTDVSLADMCLIPQLDNAHRWGVDMRDFERLTEIERSCLALPSFQAAHPDNQIDAAGGN